MTRRSSFFQVRDQEAARAPRPRLRAFRRWPNSKHPMAGSCRPIWRATARAALATGCLTRRHPVSYSAAEHAAEGLSSTGAATAKEQFSLRGRVRVGDSQSVGPSPKVSEIGSDSAWRATSTSAALIYIRRRSPHAGSWQPHLVPRCLRNARRERRPSLPRTFAAMLRQPGLTGRRLTQSSDGRFLVRVVKLKLTIQQPALLKEAI